MNRKNKLLAGGVIAAGSVVLAVVAISMAGGPPTPDAGGRTASAFNGNLPDVRNDPLAPVGNHEADRRATLNAQEAAAAAAKGEPYIAQPVIAQQVNTSDVIGEIDKAQKPLPGVTDPSVLRQPVTRTPQAEQAAQRAQEAERQAERAERQRVRQKVEEQIAALLQRKEFDPMSLTHFKAEQKPETSAGNGASTQTASASRPAAVILAAKAGDVFYASLHTGFNSDDPRGLPVFATITDYRPDNTVGPLHGARLTGQITYAEANASIVFKQITLADGRSGTTEAMAVTTNELRPGVAAEVDRHLFQRYSSLIVSSLLQGAGEVGQTITANSQRTVIQDGIAVTGSGAVNWGAAALGAVRPLGNALSNAAREGFSRKPTISSVAGNDIGIVFLQPVTMPAPARTNPSIVRR